MVKLLRCDNARENMSAAKLCQDEGLGINFEYTAPNTQQHNGRGEKKFASLFGRMRSMLNGAKLTDSLRKGLWAECANCATVNENLSVSPTTETPSYERFFCEPSKLIWNLRTFGEMAVAATRLKIQAQILNKGKYGMFVGYAPNHAPDVYRILKMENRRIVMSRDIRWLRKHYFQWSQA
jgi:hypothetical protein